MRFVILLVLTIPLILAGCSGITGANPDDEIISVTNVNNPAETIKVGRLKPFITPLDATINASLYTIALDSGKKIIAGVPPGSHIDCSIDEGVKYEITNYYPHDVIVVLAPERYGGTSYDTPNDKYYEPAPDGFEDFISVHRWGVYSIPAWSILTLPVEIDIPDDTNGFPESWEFHLVARHYKGDVVEKFIQRWLVSMR